MIQSGQALTTGQVRLLRVLAEGTFQSPNSDRKEFLVIRADAGTFALIGNSHHLISEADLSELKIRGYLRVLNRRDRYCETCCVTNTAIAYLSQLVANAPIPFLVDRSVSIVQKELPEPFQSVQGLIETAAAKLPEAKTEHDLSEIGHNCREAMQEFAALLHDAEVPGNEKEVLPKEQTVKKIKRVLEVWKARLGPTTTCFAEALLQYWGTVSDLVQKVEHRSQREQRPLTVADARRAVLYTYLVMAELTELRKAE